MPHPSDSATQRHAEVLIREKVAAAFGVAELEPDVRLGLRAAQARQMMVNPPTSPA